MDILEIIARILFSALFIMSGIGHLTKSKDMAGYAASKGVPVPTFSVLLTGVMILLGGLSFLFNFQVKIGAILLIIFLIPAAFIMHNFWKVDDPMAKAGEQAHFFKDLALAGAAFLVAFA